MIHRATMTGQHEEGRAEQIVLHPPANLTTFPVDNDLIVEHNPYLTD